MIDQVLHPFDEPHRMRQSRVRVERSLVSPAGMDVEEPRIPRRAKHVGAQATRFLTGPILAFLYQLLDRALLPGTRVKSSKGKQFHHADASLIVPVLRGSREAIAW